MRSGSFARWPFTLMCFKRVARGEFLWVPPAHSIVDINFYLWVEAQNN
jgi:hypothetical protein